MVRSLGVDFQLRYEENGYTMTHSWRELNAPELLSVFAQITGGYIMKGRDTRALQWFIDQRALAPTQMLAGMIEFKAMPDTKDIPQFLGAWPHWLEEDRTEAEVTVALYLTNSDHHPPAYWRWRDLADWDIEDALVLSNFKIAKTELEQWLNDVLDKPASLRVGGGAAGRNQQRRTSNADSG